MKRLLLPILLTLSQLISLHGQRSEVRFHHLSVEDGLSHSLVSSIVEDTLGFLWFGTQDGLNRYDGYSFKTYYRGSTNRRPSDSWISRLYIDKKNQLWIQYSGAGIERFDPQTETFHAYVPDPDDEGSISSNAVSSGVSSTTGLFFEDSENRMWIGTDRGLNLYDRQGDRFRKFRSESDNPQSLSSDRILTLFECSEGYLWVGTPNGLNRLDPASGAVKRFISGPLDDSHLSSSRINTGLCPGDGTIWVGTQRGLDIIMNPNESQSRIIHLVGKPLNPNYLSSVTNIIRTSSGEMLVASEQGLYRIRKKGDHYEQYLYPETRGVSVYRMLEDSKGNIWVSSNDNLNTPLFRLSPDISSIEVFEANKNDPYMYGGGEVLSIIESRTGLIWIGTEKRGLYRVDLNARQFRTIDNYPGRGLFISSSEVYSIYEDDQRNLYVGNKTELNRINLKDGSTIGFNNDFSLKRDITYEYSRELPARVVGVMEPTQDGKIWMGSFDYKVSLYDPVRNRFLNFHLNEADSTYFPLWSIRSICVTRSGETYFGGTTRGLCKLREDGLSFDLFPVVPTGESDGTSNEHIQYIYEDSDGIIWLGTLSSGLNRYDPIKGKFTHYVNDPEKANSISNNRIKCILEPEIHGEDILWIGTNNGGLNRFDKQNGTFTAYTMKDGLPSNTIHGILEDKVGDLWLSTNKGLAQFDPLTEEFSLYSKEDGLVGTEFNEGAFFKNKDGIMYFGGTNGINYFDPGEISEKPNYNAPVVFTGFNITGKVVLPLDTINGRVVLEQSIATTKEITLTRKERFISFEFATLDMAAAGKIRYRYMLEGFEDSWNEVDASQRFISYTNIPSGKYTLKVMGTNSDGTRFRKPTEIVLNVLPPFWQTGFFRMLAAFFIILVFLSILQIRTNVLKNQKKNLEKEVEERTRDLREANRLLAERNDEIQQMAERLHESDQMKLKFFTNISHEFRTPLTLILGPTEKLLNQEDYKNVPAIKQELELIYRNERRLFKLINQLLEVRRVETGNLRLAVTEDDLLAYLKTIHLLFMPYAEKKNMEFIFKSGLEHLRVLFDADKIEKIFYNLLSNAFKYTPAGGKIVFSVELQKEVGEWIKICVEDNGPGIDKEHLPHIFDRFYQISNKHQSARISSGIGLSLSHDLVLKHHGLIEVQSEVGRGTRFEVLIPENPQVYKKDEILVEPEKDLNMEYISAMLETYEYTSGAATERPLVGDDLFRILLVEDNLDLQKFLYNEMSNLYNVMIANNGEEALLVASKNLPDLIISDIMMPVMDGLELCKKIKGDEVTSHIPVILLTAKSGAESELSGFESGADDYITKPFNPDILKLKIRNILEVRKQLSNKFSESATYIPENIKISEIDQGFLEKFVKMVEDNIDDSELSGDRLACELGMSKGNLYKKLKTLTGMTVNIYVRTIRLKIAARLLKQGTYNISEVAYSVGFNNPKYFSTCFSEMFKVSPKEYMK
ncbi:MAG: two-component regulator propeller domain-containing protein [Bacteroides sp.]|nr:two-component regulator propeller domain-containing protein [Bacteroides sp.]